MKFKKYTVLITLAVVLCITAFSFPASANVLENEELSVNDNVESTSLLTPGGNLTVIDDVHQATDTSAENKIEDKQFITVESKNGNIFYIIIDRSGDTENVYFLNAVDETDLLALTEDEKPTDSVATCSCTTKCEIGSVNTKCAVCSVNAEACTGTAPTVEEPETSPEPEPAQNNMTPVIALILLMLLGSAGAFYWFNIRKKKSSTKGATDPNDLYEEDDEYDSEEEETEIETNEEPDIQEDEAVTDDDEDYDDESEDLKS